MAGNGSIINNIKGGELVNNQQV